MLLSELLSPDRVVVPLPAADRQTAIAVLTRRLAELSGAEYQEVLQAVLEREAVLSITYDAIDGKPVRLFFLIVGPESSSGLHVKLLSRIARLVRREPIRRQLVEASNADVFCHVLLDAEAH